MKEVIILVFLTTPIYGNAPIFRWDRSTEPSLKVTSPDGNHEIIDLKPFNIDVDDKDLHELCLYHGQIRGQNGSIVAVTGCPTDQEFEVSVRSASKDSAYKIVNGTARTLYHSIRNNVQSRSGTSGIPNLRLKVKLGYDDNFIARLGGRWCTSRSFLYNVFTHAAAYMADPTLGTKIRMTLEARPDYHYGSKWQAEEEYLPVVEKLVTDSFWKTNLYGFFDDNDDTGFEGYASLGTLCDGTRAHRTIVEYKGSSAATAKQFVHETGHLFDMYHDEFFPAERNCKGLMDSDQSLGDYWSECAVERFENYYRKIESEQGQFCLGRDYESWPWACDNNC